MNASRKGKTSYQTKFDGYVKAASLKKNKRRFCELTRLAAQRHRRDIKRSKSADFPYFWDPAGLEDWAEFVEALPHVKGTWATRTIVLDPSQLFIFGPIFGWKEKANPKRRRFLKAYIEVPRKNAKSTILAATQAFVLCMDDELGAEIYNAATKGDQARIVWDIAKSMIEATPELINIFDLEIMANAVVCNGSGSFYKPVNAKASTLDGLNPYFYSIDELHAHENRKLFDVLKSSTGSRANPLELYITTAGYNLIGVCYEQRTLAEKTLLGVLDLDRFWTVIYTLDKGDDPFLEANWFKANPLLGSAVNLDTMRGYAEEAKLSPQSEGEFKTKRLNVWLNAASHWLPMELYDRLCTDKRLKLEDFEGQPCNIGVDLADKDDIAAVVLEFYDEKKNEAVWFPFFYLPEELVKNLTATRGDHYYLWSTTGVLTLTPGDWIDHRVIKRDLVAFTKRFEVKKIAFDQFGGAQIMAADLQDDEGIETLVLPKTARNYTDPAKDFEARVKVGRFKHDGNPCLRWNASNVVVTQGVDGSILPKKESKDSAQKIDGIDAGLMATFLRMNEESSSAYEDGGIFTI